MQLYMLLLHVWFLLWRRYQTKGSTVLLGTDHNHSCHHYYVCCMKHKVIHTDVKHTTHPHMHKINIRIHNYYGSIHTGMLTLCVYCRSVLSVELWLDLEIDKNIDDYASDVVNFANSSDVKDLVENVVLGIENKRYLKKQQFLSNTSSNIKAVSSSTCRHITTITYLSLLLAIMLLTLLSASLAPVCKSSVPLFVYVN